MNKFVAHIIVIITAPLFLCWGLAVLGSEGFLFIGCLPREVILEVTLIWLAIIFIPPCVYFFIRHPVQKAYRIVIQFWSEWDHRQTRKYE